MITKASGVFGIKIQEPIYIEIPEKDARNNQKYVESIISDVNAKICKLVVVIIDDPSFKKLIKRFLDAGGIASQFINSNKLSIAV